MSATVNRPTDVKQKQEDVNRKLQFYGIATAFQNGKVPSNDQIDIALNSFLASSPIASPSKKLSAEGQALVADFRAVVKQAQYMLLTKNDGNILQDFIWQCQKLGSSSNYTLPGAPVDKDRAKQHGNEALEGLRTLGTLIISNGQFRKLLNDATILIRDIAGDAAQKTANKVNPNEDDLAQIDRPADDNTWHDVPDLSAGKLKKQVKSTYSKQTPLHQNDLKAAAGNASEAAHPDGSRNPADAAALAHQDQRQGTSAGVDGRAGAENAAATLKQRASENVPEDTKNKGRETRDRTKDYLSNKMPKERREQTIWRLKKLVVEVQGHPDYLSAIETLLSLAETYAGHATTVGNHATGAVKGARSDDSLKTAEADLLLLIERWANGTSSKDLFESINNIYTDADQDPELKSWFKKIDAYVRKCLKQQGYIMEDAATEEWNELYDRGDFLLRDRYRNHTDRIVDEFKFLGDQFDQDPVNKKFAASVQKLFTDLGNDQNGKPTFKPHLVKDLTEVILPGIFESIRYVPIPRIEFSDPTTDAIVENLVIESDNMTPNVFEVANDNYFQWNRKNPAKSNSHSVMVSISGVQMDLRDVSFHVKKKQGFSFSDTGVADIFLGGTGLSFKMKMSTAAKKDRQNFFKVDKVDVDVKNFNIKLKESKHKILFKIGKPLMLKVIRPALQKALEKLIKDKFNELDALAYKVKLEADRAIQEAKEDPESAPNIYQRYASAVQKQLLQGKQKADAVASQTKVNVAMTKHDSIFPDITLPGGISSKATEYKELGQSGEAWRSPIFKLGSASASTNIPGAPTVQRKEHSVTGGGVRGPQNVGNTDSMTNQVYDPSAQAAAQTHGSANTTFSSQVDQALNGSGHNNGHGVKPANGSTTLGFSNPVLTGSA
ncbi:hypothetical protein MBM_01841 [Drepanopeziza brunnea f. sp. 'multigermtubi' MB_m1]|uniref:Bactericidal permeability-increasing protein n=1 Tax=Marssonina brunnea f. sp. multigermtubi (strain MB_m1) TaxID=1072389 RepID=K1Y3X7_MARBU|nr:uncharacterized protein MBM_01841 [Drepanopeziza brunnea f. sp. 'multigermtubi' MB_m1]EKD19889.1 hypothetical protein MBM_01841 [Drepanopeziza brunnea f. sp. 'multigermtubi' MB_m1]